MCSRFTQTEIGPLLHRLLGPGIAELPARYNIGPGQEALAVRSLPGNGPAPARMRFGWPRRNGTPGLLLNVRAETAAAKFREALRTRRAVLPADGFYEWTGFPGDRRPWLVRRRDRQPFPLAAFWTVQEPGDLPSFVILTIPPNEVVAAIHDRMPLVLSPEDCPLWLDPAAGDPGIDQRLRPPAPGDWEAVPVSRRVNRPDVDDPSLWVPDPDTPTLF